MSQLLSIPELLIRNAEERGQKLAYSAPGREVTYGELERRTRRIAVRLARAGIGRGHFVAIVLGRCLEAVESVLAITRAGAVGVPLDPRSPPPELSNVLHHSGARAIITDSRHLSQVRAAAEGGGQTIIVVSSLDVKIASGGSNPVRYQDWAEDEECTTSNVNIDEDLGSEPAFLHYTSGTTSTPKGVLSSQQSWLWSAHSFVQAFGLTEEDKFFWPLPLFHCIGHALCIIATLTVGASAHLPDPNETLFDSLFTKQALKATIIVGAPASYHEIVNAASTSTALLALPRLRACMFGGSSAPAALSAQVQELFGVTLLNNYGCTETCGAIAVNKPGDFYREGSIPTLVPGMELKLMNPDGKEVNDGEQGEVWIRSPGLMMGYYKEVGSPFTPEGWFPTGDIARRSKHGTDLTFVGRKKELIIRGGENIQPDELERVLLQCPGVADVVVAGISHRFLGETPAAFIVREGSNTTPERDAVDLDLSALLAACRKSLPEYKTPTAFYEVNAVPRTLLGKPKRSAVASCTSSPLTARSKLLSRDSIDALVLAETAIACAMDAGPGSSDAAWLRQHSDQPFTILGLTSLAGIVLRDRLSSLTGLDLPTTLVFDHPNPQAVSEYLYRLMFRPDTSSSLPTSMADFPAADGGIEPIAIVSMACRYPGGIASPEDLWRVVSDGVDVTSEFPGDRGWNLETLYNPDPDAPGTSTTRRGAFLQKMADFDAGLFGMSPREALATDPQQRLLLETTWELAERGGIAPSSLRGTQTGVFVGIMYGDYGDNGKENPELEAHIGLGSSGSVVSGRVSYCFGLHGPSICIHTGCSSSLVAIHLAAASLRSGESSLAVAGGVTTMATPHSFISFSKRRGLSVDGRCRAYSSDADGTGWSEGVGLVLLERLQDAWRNGHRVLGVIRGSAVNSDGASNGLTAPSGPAQQQVIQKALAQAGLAPTDVDVLEGHGTATPLGDPVEVQALISAYGNGEGRMKRNVSRPLLLGSVKSNIGHTQAAAGVAGIIKMVQAIQHGVAPASLHINEPSQYIDWRGSGVELLTKTKPWPIIPLGRDQIQRPRRAAVSSFGIGGTNAHVVLEQPAEHESHRAPDFLGSLTPPATPATPTTSGKTSLSFPWLLSGADEAALRSQARKLLAAKAVFIQDPADVAFSLATTRSALRYRALVTPSGGSYEAALVDLAREQPGRDAVTAPSNWQASAAKPRLAFLFSGQGARLPGRSTLEELRAAFPVFSDAYREACDELSRHLECPLSSVFGNCEGIERNPLIDRTDFSQSFLFAFQVAMFRLLESFNISPDFVAGHSLGEIAAANASGALSLREAAAIVSARGKLMAALPSNGVMVSISASEEEVAEEILQYEHAIQRGSAAIAAVNSRNSTVLSGTTDAIMAIADKFAALGRRVTPLRNIRHAFHSPMMDPMIADLERDLVSSMKGERKSTIPLISSVTGSRAGAAQLRSTKHWSRHVRQPVRFADAVGALQKDSISVFVEIGPSAVLSPHVPDSIATSSQVNKLLHALGQLWVRGVQIDWRAVFKGTGANVVDLPVYAFQRRRYWLDPPKPAAVQIEYAGELGHDFLLHSMSIPGTSKIMCSGYLSKAKHPWLRDHVIDGQIIVPAAALTDLALRASRECTERNESMMLDEFTFVAPLALGPGLDDKIQIQVLIGEPDGHGMRTVDVYSRPNGIPSQYEWTRHATGVLKPVSPFKTGDDVSMNDTNPTKDDKTNEYHREMSDISTAYGALANAGISYGPTFQCVQAVWRTRPGPQDQKELRAHIEPPDTQKSTYALHPAVLDAALHASLLAGPDTAAVNVRLPFLFRGVRIPTSAASGPVIARIRELGEDRFSVLVTEKATGALVAEVAEVVTRAWQRPAAAAGQATGDLYRLQWVKSAQIKVGGEPKDSSLEHDEIYRVRSACHGESIVEKGVAENRVHQAVAEVLGVIQRWSADKGYSGSRLVIVTEKASVTADPDLASAAVWGFVRSAQAEFSGGRIVLVDLDGSTESEAALIPAIASKEETLSVRRGQIMVPRLSKVSPISHKTSIPASTLDVSGTVLITGGTGGLGALLSRHIARAYGAKNLLLVSRSGMEAPGAAELHDDLTSAGAVVHIEACDCGDREQLVTLFARISNQGLPPISAIIHCAGVVDDAVLSSQSPGRVSRVLRPKVDAAWHLHELAPATVRCFVLFSSFVGILGNEGQAAYTAGNSFLDALARYRLSRGLPALSLAWGPWLNEVGMAADNRLKVHNSRLDNAKPFTDQQGLDLFDVAIRRLATPEPVVMPLLVDGSFPLMSAGSTSVETNVPAGPAGGIWRKQLAHIPLVQRDGELLGLVRHEVAAVLGYQDQDLPERPLADLGFDSSTSVLLSNRLRRLTGLFDLPVTLAIDYETLPALVQYLSGRLDLVRLDEEPECEIQIHGLTIEEDIAAAPSITDPFESDKGRGLGTPNAADREHEKEHPHIDVEAFRGLTAIYKRLCQLRQYSAASVLLGSSSFALPKLKLGPNIASYAASPQRLATGPSDPTSPTIPLVFLPSFLPPVIAEGFRGSAYSTLAAEMNGERDVFELPHPGGPAVPEGLEALAAVHASTIQGHFAGPVVLAGYSAGGVVAHAVASKLLEDHQAQGEQKVQLAGLVLIDTYINMAGRKHPEWLDALPAEVLTARDGGLLHVVGDPDLALAKAGGYFRTLQDYEPASLPDGLPTLFLRAQYPTPNMPRDEEEWRPVWPQASVTVDVPGSHLELLEKRCAPASAAGIRRWVRESVCHIREG